MFSDNISTSFFIFTLDWGIIVDFIVIFRLYDSMFRFDLMRLILFDFAFRLVFNRNVVFHRIVFVEFFCFNGPCFPLDEDAFGTSGLLFEVGSVDFVVAGRWQVFVTVFENIVLGQHGICVFI